MLFIQVTGLSGAGKTTLSNRVQKRLEQLGYPVEVLDGDECRRHLWPELTYSEADRQENIRRLGYLGRIFTRRGIIVLLAAINPYERIRAELNQQNQPAKTVFIDCDLQTLIHRDTKGLYTKALLPDTHPNKLHDFTGINAPYETPVSPDLTIHTGQQAEADCEEQLFQFILAFLRESVSKKQSLEKSNLTEPV
ncbi:adenylyl-sulfate kinase [Spirosoma validum]|uniref:Adenylyl-sulfate kinase n=1 Tax=Spirosoma validum TaxID=2771355 RepID=A0A927B4Z2_9BACT|nr:adenylyl-sulfate kinase [Spirosoma validum]MBD2755750.1 adenylyl-sulfate kinase [Spirosoma validum]